MTQSNRSMETYSEMSQKHISINEKTLNSSDFETKDYLKKQKLLTEISEKKSVGKSQLQANSEKSSNSYRVSLCVNSFSKILLETGVYIAALKSSEGFVCRANKCLNEKPCNASLCHSGDRVMSINGISLKNKPIHDIFELFKNCKYFDLVLLKENSSSENKRFSSNNFIDLTRSQTESLVESISENQSVSKSSNQPHSSKKYYTKMPQRMFDSNESIKFFDSKGNLIPISRENNRNLAINSKTKQYNFQSNPKAVRPLNESHFYSNDDI
jgi:hypothetical protein